MRPHAGAVPADAWGVRISAHPQHAQHSGWRLAAGAGLARRTRRVMPHALLPQATGRQALRKAAFRHWKRTPGRMRRIDIDAAAG